MVNLYSFALTEIILNDPTKKESASPVVRHVAAGADQFGEVRSLGISTIAFKVVPHDGNGLLT